jgi:hypothetical protein
MLDSLSHHRMPTGAKAGISRRGFLKGVAGVLAGGALLAIGERVLGTTWVPQPLPMSLQRSTFARYLGDMFQVAREPSDVIALQLIRVESLPSNTYTEMRGSANEDQEHCFSIVFRGPADRPLGQGTYHFEHGQIGGFPLFIVPRVPDQSGQYYEAIFNCPPS